MIWPSNSERQISDTHGERCPLSKVKLTKKICALFYKPAAHFNETTKSALMCSKCVADRTAMKGVWEGTLKRELINYLQTLNHEEINVEKKHREKNGLYLICTLDQIKAPNTSTVFNFRVEKLQKRERQRKLNHLCTYPAESVRYSNFQ